MDTIELRGLELCAVIGTLESERCRKQKLVFDIYLDCDASAAAKSDNLNDTFDYSALEDRIAELVEQSSFFLIEALAGAVADLCISVPEIKSAAVRLEKREASIRAGAVAVTVRRTK